MGSLGRLPQLMVCWKEDREINVQRLLVVRPLADVTLQKRAGWNERAVYPTQTYIMPSLHMEGHA